MVVQSWLDGVVTADPPPSDDEWRQLVGHYAAIRTVTPDKVSLHLETAVINFDSVTTGRRHIQQQGAAIPAKSQPASLKTLRMLYEVPLGLDQRLVARPPDWRTRIQARYNGYVAVSP